MRLSHLLWIVVSLQLPLLAAAADPAKPAAGTQAPASTAGLPIGIPADFRARFVHLGSWVVSDKTAPGHGFHDFYTEPKTVKAYRKTGKFPEGATLVKEIRGLKSATLTTGKATWAAEPMVWFVMVKDGQGRHKDSPLWGDGWLWALYKTDAPSNNVAKSYQADCFGCHVPAAKTDRVFIEGYPTLGR